MYENHYYAKHQKCPCKIGTEAVQKAAKIFAASENPEQFAQEMERQRVIGKKIWFENDTIFIMKVYATDDEDVIPDNIISKRCHCDFYIKNAKQANYPKTYCKCGAEFYRPMFAPLFGADVLIEPYKTVLSGDECCVLAVRINCCENEVR